MRNKAQRTKHKERSPRSVIGCFIALMTAVLLGGGCSSTAHLNTPHAGRTLIYEPGLPNFDMEALATVRDGQAGIDLYLGIPHASLVFLPHDDGYEARFETLVRLMDRKGKMLLAEYADADTTRVPTYAATQDFVPVLKQKRLEVAPGDYLLDVVLTDAESKKHARRRQRVEVVAVGTARPVLSRVRVEGKRGGTAFAPILSLHVPAGLDSLRSAVELYNAHHLDEVQVAMHLLRFPSDTAAAEPPYLFTVARAFGRVRYTRADTLQVSHRRLRELDQKILLEFDLPTLTEGIYRVDVRVMKTDADDEEPLLHQRRDFVVRSATFPHITTLDEMAGALVYIARQSERQHIQAADTPEEKKRRFDAFWATLIPDRTRAANLLKLYYSRVEEANLRYTSYKEGWKTDRGMIYILFGSPIFIDTQLEYEVWRYSYDDRDGRRVFVFNRRWLYASEGMFDTFLLEREPFYEAAWRRALQRWRRGEVL